MVREEKFTTQKAKEIDLVEYMATLGLQPTRTSGYRFWYLSPFPDRNERTASMMVDRRRNRWIDFGDGRKGSIIDFVILYNQCDLKQALGVLSGKSASVQPFVKSDILDDPSGHIKVINERVISSPYLVRYLHDRRISLHVANQFCKEIDFTNHDKQYTAIGFKNNFGGYEIRNRYFKGSSSPKDVTHIDNQSTSLLVFEGFMDFLSYQMLNQNQKIEAGSFLILNSLSFIERARSIIDKYREGQIYLDQDDAGRKATAKLLEAYSHFRDASDFYQKYKDLNDMLMTIGMAAKQQHQPYRKI